MVELANRVGAMPAMRVVQLTGRAAEMKEPWEAANPGFEFVPLLYGDVPWRFPRIRRQIIRRYPQAPSGYLDPKGEAGVRKLIAKDFERDGVLGIDPDKEVCVTNGVLEALQLACAAVLNPGDQVIVPTPYYFFFPHQVARSDATMRLIDTKPENDYKLTPEELEAAITQKTKMLFLNYPGNPRGYVYSFQEFDALARVLMLHPHISILADEVYFRTYFGGDSHTSILAAAPELKNRTIVARSLAKMLASPEERAGWAVGSSDIIGAMQQQLKAPGSWANPIASQLAIQFALSNREGTDHVIDEINGKLRQGHDFMLARLREMRFDVSSVGAGIFLFPEIPEELAGLIPDAAPEVGVDTIGLSSSERLAWFLLSHGTAVVPGDDSGVPDCFRVTFALDVPQLEAATDNMRRGLQAMGWL